MDGAKVLLVVVLLLQVATSQVQIRGRYVKREEKGTQSRLRFTSGSYGFYNASIKESHTSTWTTIKCDMKMGIYIYDAHMQIDYEVVDDFKRFSVRSQKIADFVFLRVMPNGVLNSNIQSVYTINVIARDSRTRELIDRTKIYLHVLDINEFKPQFVNLSIEINIKENIKVGSTVLRVKANDPDSGLNGEVLYFIEPSQVLEIGDFSLNYRTGALSLIKPLDFKRKRSYDFHIIAKDMCSYGKLQQQSDPLPVRINILDVEGYPESGRRRDKRQENFDGNKHRSLLFSNSAYIASVAEISPPFTPIVRVEIKQESKKIFPNVLFGLVDGNERGFLHINSRTGQIYTVEWLDYEKAKVYNLTVIALHRNRIKGKATVTIHVLDSNDHSPVFEQFRDSTEIVEETPPGTVIYNAKASDFDTGLNGKIIYSIANANETYFDIDPYNGAVQVVKRLDRDGQKSVPQTLYLLLRASDFGAPIKREGRMILKVTIKGTNDNPPVMPFLSCRISVAENARLGTKVMRINALDLDQSSTGYIYNASGNMFSIGKHTGDLTLKSISADQKRHHISISVSDGKFLSHKLDLVVFVVANNHQRTINVSCTDNPLFGVVKKTISERSKWEKVLKVEQFSPIVTPQRKVHKPIFLEKPENPILLSENLPVGSYITTILAVDRKLKCYGLVLYSIISGSYNVDSNFGIDMLNGTIYLSSKLDREQTSFYTLRIRAYDTDSPPQYAEVDVQIQVVDVNDNGPIFSQKKYHFSVSEKTQPGTRLVQVSASDPDKKRNGEVIYSMLSDYKELFFLNKYTGLITLNSSLDYEKQNKYIITIQASDRSSQDQKVSQTTVEISIEDVNDTPPKCLPAIQTVEITRDFPAGAVLGKVFAFDPDTGNGGKVRYDIARGKLQRIFHIDNEYGILRTNVFTIGQLAKDHVYNISIIVKDLGAPSLSSSCHFVCRLKPSVSSERPRFLRSENPIVVDIKNQNDIITIDAAFEGSRELQYKIVDGSGIGDFKIDSKTGTISRTTTGDKIMRPRSNYWLTVNAHLKDNPEVYSNAAILLLKRNNVMRAPYFDPTVYRVSVEENLPAKTNVLQLSVVDPNSRMQVSDLIFNIVDGNALKHFAVDSNGTIQTTRSLDRETHDTYRLNISVSKRDLADQLSFASVLIAVDDTNDNTPEASYKVSTIWEQDAQKFGTFVTQIVAFDRDIGKNGELSFEILEKDSLFDIDSKGVVTTKEKLTAFEDQFLSISISDRGTPPKSTVAYLEIGVKARPSEGIGSVRFKGKSFTYKIKESTQRVLKQQHIEHLSKLVIGQEGFLQFTIVSGNEDNKFHISGFGDLSQISELDYETKVRYEIVIRVNNGHSSDSAVFIILVEDLNDNAPKTSQSCYQAEALENEGTNKVIAQIEALDPDSISKGKLVYKLIGVSPRFNDTVPFEVDVLSGKIKAFHSFDREVQSNYILTLLAEDHTSVTVLRTTYCVKVDIKDANDHKPRFTQHVYTTNVFSPIPVGVPILRLLAVDDDIGTNALLKFSITGGNSGGHFSIDSVTGVISSGQSFASDKKSTFSIDVEVSDSGLVRTFKDQSKVKITVFPAKRKPGFSNDTYHIVVPENQEPTPVLDVSISNIQVYYKLLPCNGSSLPACVDKFHVDFLSGVISSKVPSDAEVLRACCFAVHGWDDGGFSNTSNVIVHVKDLNDNRPKFVNSSYTGSVDEGSGRGSEVLDLFNKPLVVEASDADSGENSRIVFSIVEASASHSFEIDSKTGKLSTKRVLDREKRDSFVFHVRATDSGTPSLFTFTELRIIVNDINDRIPEFTNQIYRVQLYTPIFNGTEVVTVHANDGDSNVFSSVRYNLLNHTPLFKVSPKTGTIWTKNAGAITKNTYSLQVAASDGIFTSTCQVVISLSPIKTNKFKFREPVFQASIIENHNESRYFLVLNVVGYEIGERIEFSIANPKEEFVINSVTGEVSTRYGAAFDREKNSHFELIVQAKLMRDPSQVAQGILNVTVADVNDNKPEFIGAPYYQSVHIDTSADTSLLQVHAVDADEGSNAEVRYEITGGSFGKFSIEERTGVIKVKEQFIKGKTPGKFSLEVTAYDMGSPMLKTVTVVEVPVVNEDMPVFDQNYKFVVSENALPGTIIGKIVAQGPQRRSVYYSIASGDEFNQFSLDFNTGELSTLDVLDTVAFPRYNLSVQATDSKSGSWSVTGCSISVIDTNNHRPMFSQAFYSANVLENTTKGTLVITLIAKDKDFGENARVSYSLVSENEKKPLFKIDETTGSVLVAAELDYEVRSEYIFRVKAEDHGLPSLSSSTFLKINIIDVNDHSPIFDQKEYIFTVGDFVKSGQFIGKVLCIDTDHNSAGKIRYLISDSTLATVGMFTGILTLNRSPKRGSTAQFKVHCSDGKFKSSADVTVIPEEVNEHKPTFHMEQFSISVQEDSAPSFMTVVTATDLDYGSYGTITYSIDSSRLAQMFHINPTTGDVFSKVTLDREQIKGQVVVPVRASDIGGRFDICKLIIDVIDANDNGPVFEFPGYEATVSTATPIGTTVLHVKAFDEDSGKNGDITYSISGLDDGAPWKINKETGELALTGTPQGKAYQFVIQALDNGYPGRESSSAIRINVVPPEPKILQFSRSSFTVKIAESKPSGYRVADVTVKSGSKNIVYKFVEGNLPLSNASGMFLLDSKSGAIHLEGTLDYETVPRYNLMVMASDTANSGPAAYINLHIIVLNVNDNPPVFDTKVYEVTIPENIPVNTNILQVSATDKDDFGSGVLRYHIIKSPSKSDIQKAFTLNKRTGILKTSSVLDFEKTSSYEIEIKVTDGRNSDEGKLHDTAKIRITVLDTNDSPPVIQNRSPDVRVREDLLINEKVATVLAKDADKNPSIRYFIVKGNEFGRFSIGADSGDIRLVRPLDREVTAAYDLEVVAYDGAFTSSTTMHVSVTDTNDNAPVCSRAFYEIKLPEGTQAGQIISRIEAKDPDSDDQLAFTLQGDGVSKFLINNGNGELMPGIGIDRESHATSEFKVLVTDKVGRSCYSDVYVEILDKNDNKPVFAQENYVVPVRENASLSSMLARVQAVDADKGLNRKVSYRMTGSDLFSIQPKTGIILLEKSLSKEKKDSHMLTVEAFDGGSPALASSATVNIIVLAESDRPPEFSKAMYTFSVSEGLAVSSVIGKIEALKRAGPSQGTVDYELVTGDLNMFTLDGKTGELSLAKELDHEKAKRISLSVRARYAKVPSLTSVVQVVVYVTDENDNRPVFSKPLYAAKIDENVRAGTVLQVFAEDADEGDNAHVSYRLVKSDKNVPFKVDKKTGTVSVAGTGPIDREEKDFYVFKVRAFDAGTPSQFSDVLVNVTIADLNDNPPDISPSNATVVVTEGRGRGHVIFSWTASDRDTMKNGPPFTYTLIEGDKNKFSVVDESDVKGSLIANKNLSRSEGFKYDLVVRVTDNGSPPQSSLCYLTLHIVPPSDEKPVILEPTMFFKVISTSPQTVTVGRVRVPNEGKYLHQFEITAGNDDGTFSIEPVSGLIKGNVRQGIYTISVEVFDGKFSASATITVIVNLITKELYQNSVVLTALDLSADDFVNYKIKKFANHIRLITSAKIENIIIWAVQTKDMKRKTRDVGSRTDTDIAFAVRRTNGDGFIEPSVLQSSLKLSKETLETKLGVSVLITVTDPCAAAPCPVDKRCIAVVKPVSGSSALSTGLSTKFSRNYACLCLDGSEGPDCTGITACSSNPCKENEKCIPIGSTYECKKDMNDGAIQLDGKDYVSYVLREPFDSTFKSISVSFRTEASEGYLFYAKGNDYCFLEVFEGKVRFKFDFGTGQGIVQIDDIQVNDGRWHDVKVIRSANRATLILDDGKYKSEGRAKGENVKINLDSNNVFFGAGVLSQGSVENGFRGCLRYPKLNGQLLPWNGNNSLILSGRSYGVKKSCKGSGACRKTKCPHFSDCIDTLSAYRCQCMPGHRGTLCKPTVTCADNPCRNGGTCTYFKANSEIEYRCTCKHPYTGAQCQTNSGLCASNPCKNGGKCENLNEGTDYRCMCPQRYRGPKCELDTNPCASSPCFYGARCTTFQYDYKCDCPPGQKGKRCGFGSYCQQHSCGKHGLCKEAMDGPVCKCKKGYKGAYCQFDINECLSSENPCGDWGTCINTIGSFFCNCTNGQNSPNCIAKGSLADRSKPFNFNLLLYVGAPIVIIIIIIAVVVCVWRRKSKQEYSQPRDTDGPDIKYPLNCIELDQFPPHVPPRFDGPPDYYTDGSADFATTALYDPSQAVTSPQSTMSDDDRCLKAPDSSALSRKLLSTFRDGSQPSTPRGSANALDAKGSASDISEAEDQLNGPYHWDYCEVPEDVANRSKPTRTRSKEGSRMGLSYNYGYEDTPKLPEKQSEKPAGRSCRRSSMTFNENERPAVPERPADVRLSWQSLAVTETGSPVAARVKKRNDTKQERSPTIQRAAASRGSDSSLLEPYECITTQLSAKDFNNRYSLALEDNTSLYLQDLLGGEYPAPPSETCPSDIESCTRPSLSVAFSDTDEVPYRRQRRMLPSEISCLDADNLTETSYNSDDENDDFNEQDPLDPDQTRKLEREIKILFKEIKSKTEADEDD